MRKPAGLRKLIALLAAYVVVLQIAVLPLTVAAFAGADSGICQSGAAAEPHPGAGDEGCPCAAGCGAQCCVQVLSAPPAQAWIEASLPLSTEIAASSIATELLLRAERSAHSPRAPPSA